MSVIHAPQKPVLTPRFYVFPAAIVTSLLVIFFRLWFYQVVEADNLAEKAENSRFDLVPRLAPRGLMFDRNHKLIAGVQSKFVIMGVPSEIKKDESGLIAVASWLNVPVEQLRSKLKEGRFKPYLPTAIAIGVPVEVASRIAEGQELPGISVEQQPMRTYVDGRTYAHVLGYVWKPTKKDVERLTSEKVPVPAYVGRDGLERYYDSELMGTDGAEKMEVDAKRRPLRLAGRDAPQPGSQLTLTIDNELQKIALQELSGRVGAVVALDPKTGEVLAIASSPSYDASQFLNGVRLEDWKALNAEENNMPLYNRATRGAYPPGSTFKIVTSIAAERAGKFSLTSPQFCPGYVEVGNHKTKCLGTHGSITFDNAFTRSCNAYFGKLGLLAGGDILRQTALDCGLYSQTGIDLPSESRGIVPTEEFIKRRNKKRKWYTGDTVNLAIGQGEIATTPLQMACIVGMVSQNGVMYRPHLVKEVQDPEGAKTQVAPEISHKIDLPDSFWTNLKHALWGVVDHGTARNSRIEGIAFGGKTGSAEHKMRKTKHGAIETKTHSWFVGVAPLDNPKIAIAVLAEAAGHGGDVSAPIASRIVRSYLMRPSASAASSASRLPNSSALPASSTRPN